MAVVGVTVLSAACPLLRKLADVGAGEAAFWRNVLISMTLVGYFAVNNKLQEFRQILQSGLSGLAIIVLYGLHNCLFVFSVSHTTVANTIVILAATPLFAAEAINL